ncbi:hypothetical protein AUP68_14728 [Ilyonectria robusta]
MASLLFLPRDGIILKIFLVVASFLIAPSVSAAVGVKLSQRSPPPYQRPQLLASRLFDRDDSSCALENYTQCGSQVPDNLCCPDDTKCMIIASNTTIVCCPNGSDCGTIKPIVCNVALQDTAKHPGSPIQTLALSASMETCGSACCPFGYICEGDSHEESWGYFSTPDSTRRVCLARGPDDKFIVTPSTAGFSPPPVLQEPGYRDNSDPVELPATPVSLCMWMNLEDASVEEPKLAYVVPAKHPNRR